MLMTLQGMWQGKYLIHLDADCATAQRIGGTDVITADTIWELRELIRSDAIQCVACHDHGTTQRRFLPRAWDHPVASDGTTRRVVPGVLITDLYGCLQVDRLGGSGDGIPGGCRD